MTLSTDVDWEKISSFLWTPNSLQAAKHCYLPIIYLEIARVVQPNKHRIDCKHFQKVIRQGLVHSYTFCVFCVVFLTVSRLLHPALRQGTPRYTQNSRYTFIFACVRYLTLNDIFFSRFSEISAQKVLYTPPYRCRSACPRIY